MRESEFRLAEFSSGIQLLDPSVGVDTAGALPCQVMKFLSVAIELINSNKNVKLRKKFNKMGQKKRER